MKTISQRFDALIELRNIGCGVLSAKVGTSYRFDSVDADRVSFCILDEFLPVWSDIYRLYDGSYIVLSDDDDKLMSDACVSRQKRSLSGFDVEVELQDGAVHSVSFLLNQSDDPRSDYKIGNVRYVRLRGEVSVAVADDEEDEKVESK